MRHHGVCLGPARERPHRSVSGHSRRREERRPPCAHDPRCQTVSNAATLLIFGVLDSRPAGVALKARPQSEPTLRSPSTPRVAPPRAGLRMP